MFILHNMRNEDPVMPMMMMMMMIHDDDANANVGFKTEPKPPHNPPFYDVFLQVPLILRSKLSSIAFENASTIVNPDETTRKRIGFASKTPIHAKQPS